MRKVKRLPKAIYQAGGTIPYGDLMQIGSQAFAANAYTNEGAPDVSNMTMSSALKGAGTGFAAGNMVFPGIGGIVGAVGGAVIGGITGNAKAEKQAAAYALQKRRAEAVKNKIEEAQTAAFLKVYPSQGMDYTTLFKNGGNIQKVVNGYLKPLSPGVTKAKGPKHKQGGIDLITTGKGQVEVEGGEVIKSEEKVFSDKLRVPGSKRTYADVAERIATTPAYIRNALRQQKLEAVIQNPRNNQYKMGTATRQLQSLVNPLDRLFDTQELHKQSMNMKNSTVKAEYGLNLNDNGFRRRVGMLRNDFFNRYGSQIANYRNQRPVSNSPYSYDLEYESSPPANPDPTGPPSGERGKTITGFNVAQGIGAFAPFIDNLVNMGITNRTPTIPAPTYVKAPLLQTKYNIQPQLYEIGRAAAARNKLLTENTANPQTLRANVVAGYSNDISARNQLYGQKTQVETDLQNKQVYANYENALTNAGKFDEYQRMKMVRLDDIGRRQSMNAANLSEDLQMKGREGNMKMRDQQELALIALKYAESGILDRSEVFDVLEQIEAGTSLASIRRALATKRKKKEEDNKEAAE